MSLGIKSSWRAGHRSLGALVLSLVPRELSISLGSRRGPRLSSASDAPRPAHTGLNDETSGRGTSTAAAERTVSPGGELLQRLSGLPLRPHGLRNSILVRPLIPYPHKKERHRSKQEHDKSIRTQLRLEKIRMVKKQALPNWRVVLQNLTAWTMDRSSVWHDDALKIVVPAGFEEELISGVDTSVWAIARRNDCVVRLYREEQGDGSSFVVLSGLEEAMNSAVDDILSIVRKGTVIHLPKNSPTGSAARSSKTLDPSGTVQGSTLLADSTLRRRREAFRLYKLAHSAYDIPKPKIWTKQSFERYIAALVNGRMTPQQSTRIYPTGTTHESAVISLLHAAFHDEAARESLSVSALKMALLFMSSKGPAFRPDARALFVRAELQGLHMDAEPFNILALSMVKVRDLHGFDTTVRLMASRGHAPNLGTWLLFLRMLESEEVKRQTLQAMHAKGLLGTAKAIRQVAWEMAAWDADRASVHRTCFDEFMAEQEARYGSGWLTRDAGNRIIEVWGRYGRFDDCARLIELMSEQRVSWPDVVTLNTFLSHIKTQRRPLFTAIPVLRRLEALGGGSSHVTDDITYHLLFETAYRALQPNALNVLWRYACLESKTSWTMRRRVSAILTERSPQDGPGSRAKLTGLAAPGALIDKEGLAELCKAEGGEDSRTAADRRPLGTAIARWYQSRYQGWEAVRPLSEMLQAALERDSEFHRALAEDKSQQQQQQKEVEGEASITKNSAKPVASTGTIAARDGSQPLDIPLKKRGAAGQLQRRRRAEERRATESALTMT